MLHRSLCALALLLATLLTTSCGSMGLVLPDEHLAFPIPDGAYALTPGDAKPVRIDIAHAGQEVVVSLNEDRAGIATAHRRGTMTILQVVLDDPEREHLPKQMAIYLQLSGSGPTFTLRTLKTQHPKAQAAITKALGATPWYKPTDPKAAKGLPPKMVSVPDAAALKTWTDLVFNPDLYPEDTTTTLAPWTAANTADANAPEGLDLDAATAHLGSDLMEADDTRFTVLGSGGSCLTLGFRVSDTKDRAQGHVLVMKDQYWTTSATSVILVFATRPAALEAAKKALLAPSLHPTEESWTIDGVPHRVLVCSRDPALLATIKTKLTAPKP